MVAEVAVNVKVNFCQAAPTAKLWSMTPDAYCVVVLPSAEFGKGKLSVPGTPVNTSRWDVPDAEAKFCAHTVTR